MSLPINAQLKVALFPTVTTGGWDVASGSPGDHHYPDGSAKIAYGPLGPYWTRSDMYNDVAKVARLDAGKPASFATVFNVNSLSPASPVVVYSTDTTGNVSQRIYIQINSNNTISISYRDIDAGDVRQTLTTTATVPLGRHAIAATIDANFNLKLYLDNALVLTQANCFVMRWMYDAGSNRYGSREYGTPLFSNPGIQVYAIFAWQRALSPGEVGSINDNPYQVVTEEQYTYFSVGAAPINLTAATTVQGATSSAGAASQAHVPAAAGSREGSASGAGAVTQTQTPGGSASAQGDISGTGTTGQTQVLGGADSGQGAISGTGAASPNQALTGAPTTQANTSSIGAVSQAHSVTGSPASQVSGSPGAAAGQVRNLAAGNANQVNISSPGQATQRHQLGGAASMQTNVSGSGAVDSSAPGIYVPSPFKFTSPSRAKVFSSPSRACSLVSPSRAQLYASPSRACSFTSPARAN